MRIVTRGDFDGLASSVLVTSVEKVREIRFAHPKDAQDGLVGVDAEDIVINIPYIPGCGLWFDHHVSEAGTVPPAGSYKGRFEIAPSCARVIANYYADRPEIARFTDLIAATDRLDAANLTLDDVTQPKGWILLGLTLDPRSGLGPEFQKYFRWLVEYIKEVSLDEVLAHPEVKKRTDRILKEQEEFKALLAKHATVDSNVILVDFRHLAEKPIGNRFLVFTMYPQANVEIRLLRGLEGKVTIAVGHSIFNRTCGVNIGELCKRYGGGGHRGAGTCQVPGADADRIVGEIKQILLANKA